jgi:hypothetical protein
MLEGDFSNNGSFNIVLLLSMLKKHMESPSASVFGGAISSNQKDIWNAKLHCHHPVDSAGSLIQLMIGKLSLQKLMEMMRTLIPFLLWRCQARNNISSHVIDCIKTVALEAERAQKEATSSKHIGVS